jgi:hypothetical protein
MRAVPEDTPAAPAAKEALAVPKHARRNPINYGTSLHCLQLPVALHATRRAPGEVEAPRHQAELVIHWKVRHHEERYLLVPHRLALEKAPVAGKKDAPFL